MIVNYKLLYQNHTVTVTKHSAGSDVPPGDLLLYIIKEGKCLVPVVSPPPPPPLRTHSVQAKWCEVGIQKPQPNHK